MGAAFIIGGMNKEGVLTCDIWSLDLDYLIDYIEQPD